MKKRFWLTRSECPSDVGTHEIHASPRELFLGIYGEVTPGQGGTALSPEAAHKLFGVTLSPLCRILVDAETTEVFPGDRKVTRCQYWLTADADDPDDPWIHATRRAEVLGPDGRRTGSGRLIHSFPAAEAYQFFGISPLEPGEQVRVRVKVRKRRLGGRR